MAQAKIEYREQPIGVSNSSVFGRAFNTLNKQLRATAKNKLTSAIIGAYEAIATGYQYGRVHNEHTERNRTLIWLLMRRARPCTLKRA